MASLWRRTFNSTKAKVYRNCPRGCLRRVVGLDKDGTINLPNHSASELLGVELDEVIGQRMADVVVELAPLIDSAARSRSRKPTEGEIRITRNNETHTLLVRIGSEWSEGKIAGFVITFDDISQLLAAQRRPPGRMWRDASHMK